MQWTGVCWRDLLPNLLFVVLPAGGGRSFYCSLTLVEVLLEAV